MNRTRQPLLHLFLVLLIAAAPLQGVFAGAMLATAPGQVSEQVSDEPGQPAQMAGMGIHYQHQIDANSTDQAGPPLHHATGDLLAGGCDCCPDGLPGSCSNCAVTHCMTHHCASAAVLPLALRAAISNDGGAWVLPQLAQLPPSTHSTPFRPPRA